MSLIKIKVKEKSPTAAYRKMVGQERFGIARMSRMSKAGVRGKQIATEFLKYRIDWCKRNRKMPGFINALKRGLKSQSKVSISYGTLRNVSDETLKQIVDNLK